VSGAHFERQASHQNQLRASVRHINSAGPLVKVDLATERGHPIHVEISHERYQELQPKERRCRLHKPPGQ